MFYLLFTGCFIFEGENEYFSLVFLLFSSRLNVIESIDHFCVDLLEFPDYIPEDARVWLANRSLRSRI